MIPGKVDIQIRDAKCFNIQYFLGYNTDQNA